MGAERGLGLVLVVAIARFAQLFAFKGPLPDEGAYVEAFARVAAHRDPYEVARYVYPPFFAHAGAALVALLGQQPFLVGLRIANVAGAAAIAWLAARCFERPAARLLVASALVAFAPPIVAGVSYGNVTPVATALLLAGAVLAASRPIPAGLLLALGLAFKPLGVVYAIVLLARPATRRAAAIGLGLFAGTLLVDLGGLRAMLARGDAAYAWQANGSLHRVLLLLGLPVPSAILVAASAVGGLALARRRVRSRDGAAAVAACAPGLASPLVWTHTLAVALPRMALVARDAWLRYLRARTREALLAAVLAVLGVTIVMSASMFRDFVELPRGVQAPLVAVPLVALALLTRAALISSGDASRSRPRP